MPMTPTGPPTRTASVRSMPCRSTIRTCMKRRKTPRAMASAMMTITPTTSAPEGLRKTGDTSVTTQKFDWLQSSGIDLTSQAEIYFADMASDKVLETQAELEMSSGITAVQFYQYKVASSGMTKKAEKMQAINSLNLTSAQKDAIYYAEGWAQSTIRDKHRGAAGMAETTPANHLRAADICPILQRKTGTHYRRPHPAHRATAVICSTWPQGTGFP